jgi:hypothetical protein
MLHEVGMAQYDISISPDEVNHEYRVLLRGPGIDGDGKRYVFISPERCTSFVEAVNFAYRQGLRDGLRHVENRGGELLLVSGTTPDNMMIRRAGWWARVKRRWQFIA